MPSNLGNTEDCRVSTSLKVNCLQRITMKRTSLSIAGVSTFLIAASLGAAKQAWMDMADTAD
jgi:hypothetical protein